MSFVLSYWRLIVKLTCKKFDFGDWWKLRKISSTDYVDTAKRFGISLGYRQGRANVGKELTADHGLLVEGVEESPISPDPHT